MARLGVIGGLGPMATAYFMELMIRMTDVQQDQEHPEIIVLNFPSVPDRTAYLLGKSQDDPLAPMVEMGRQLKALGATVVATPCITAHYFHQALQKGVDLPVIDAIRATVELLCSAGVQKVGLLASDGTVQSRIFQQRIEEYGMELILPSREGQRGVMKLIYDQIKAGVEPDMALFADLRDELLRAGAEVIVLGCTELSLLKKKHDLGNGILDALEVLAKESVLACGKTVREEYTKLI